MKKRLGLAFLCTLITFCYLMLCGFAEEVPPEETPVPTATPKPTAIPHGDFVETQNSWAALRGAKLLIGRIHQEHMIPSLVIYTQDLYPVYSLVEYIPCRVYAVNGGEGFDMTGEEEPMKAEMRVRGNSSAYYGNLEEVQVNQVPYRIRFEEKQNLFGLNDGVQRKNWVLVKADWNLVANDMAYRLGRTLLRNNYCTDSMLCHVYLNGKFAGIYVLCEQSQTGEGRVEIYEADQEETGTDIGYFLELDNYYEDPYITVMYGEHEATDLKGETRAFIPAEYTVHSCINTQEQLDFIGRYINNVFEVVYQACVNGKAYTLNENAELIPSADANLTPKATISAVLDLDAAVDMYILEQIVCNNDVGEGSFYMCVDFSQNSNCRWLRFTCPWDFGWGYEGKANKGYFAASFCSASFVEKYGDRTNPWLVLLCSQDWFRAMVTERLDEVKDDLNASCKEEMKMLSLYEMDLMVENAWSIGCARDLVNWVQNRIRWLDSVY